MDIPPALSAHNRHDHVQAFAARRFDEWRQAEFNDTVAYFESGTHDITPAQSLIGIEIEYDPIRPFGLVDPTAPGMKLHGAELRKRQKALCAMDEKEVVSR